MMRRTLAQQRNGIDATCVAYFSLTNIAERILYDGWKPVARLASLNAYFHERPLFRGPWLSRCNAVLRRHAGFSLR